MLCEPIHFPLPLAQLFHIYLLDYGAALLCVRLKNTEPSKGIVSTHPVPVFAQSVSRPVTPSPRLSGSPPPPVQSVQLSGDELSLEPGSSLETHGTAKQSRTTPGGKE